MINSGLGVGGREFTYINDYGERVGIQRNVVGRVLSNADTYRVVVFQPYVDYVLYFTVRDGGASIDGVRQSLEILGKVGIGGGERSIGLGHFTVVDVASLIIHGTQEATHYYLVLPCHASRRTLVRELHG